jgi:hypothetical protein
MSPTLDYKQLAAEETSHGVGALPADAVTVGKVTVANTPFAGNVTAAPDMKINNAVTTALGSSASNASPLLTTHDSSEKSAVLTTADGLNASTTPQAPIGSEHISDGGSHDASIGSSSLHGGTAGSITNLAGLDGISGTNGSNGNDGGILPGGLPEHALPLNLDTTVDNVLGSGSVHLNLPPLSDLPTTSTPLATVGETGSNISQVLTSTGLVPQGLQPLLQSVLPSADSLNVGLPAPGEILSGTGHLLGLSLDGTATHGSVANIDLTSPLGLPVDTSLLHLVTDALPGGLIETSIPQGVTPQTFTDSVTQMVDSTLASGTDGLLPNVTTLPDTLTNLPNMVLADVTGQAQTDNGSLLDTHLLDQTSDPTSPTSSLSLMGNDASLPTIDTTGLLSGSGDTPTVVTLLDPATATQTVPNVVDSTLDAVTTAVPEVAPVVDAVTDTTSSLSGVVADTSTSTTGSVESWVDSVVSGVTDTVSTVTDPAVATVTSTVDDTTHAIGSALTTITNTAASAPTVVTTLPTLGHDLFHH